MVKFNYPLPEIISSQETGEYFGPENEYLLRQLNSLLTQKQNIHGRRIGKAKDAISPGDYVTKRQLNGTLVGTLAQRPQPANVVVGTTYFATDRNVTYIQRGGHWYYYTGIQDVTLSPNTKPSPSILYDTGYMIYATDFDWYYRWNLITWERLHGTSGAYLGFPANFTKVGWHKLDGATVNISNDDGTVTSIILDNFTIPHFIKYGFAHGDVAAVTPTISGSTGATSNGHTHNVTATGTVTGNLPAHKHNLLDNLIDSGGVLISNAVFLDGTAWNVAGTVTDVTVSGTTGSPDHLVTVCTTIPDTDVGSSSHGHNWGQFNGTGTFTDTSEDHFHLITGTTEDSGTPALTLTFTGSSVVSSDQSVSHTHTGSSLVISNDGSPLAHQLIPYIRL